MAQSGSNKKVASSLVALSSAAVLAVYSAGYVRTRTAADRFAVQDAERRPAGQAPAKAVAPVAPGPDLQPAASARAAAPMRAATPPERRRAAAEPMLSASSKPVPASIEAPAVAATALPAEIPAPAAAPVVAAAVAPPPPPVVEQKPAEPAVAPAPPAWKDGTYLGWGHCRHGDIQASVVIEAGRIASATIAQCLTRYSCSVIEALIPQVAQRQSPEVDWVSGATQSADAFSYAVADALAKAK